MLLSEATETRTNDDATAEPPAFENTLKCAVMVMLLPDWRGIFGWNEFDSSIVYLRDPPIRNIVKGERLTDDDITSIRLWCSLKYSVEFSRQNIFDAIRLAARKNSFHPVREYLQSLEWDGTSRVEGWLEQFCGVKPTSDDHCRLIHSVAKKWLISCVARVFEPGCKVDTMLILEGKQGIGKSRALRALAGEELFSDSLLDFGTKDACQTIQGVWIYELSELDAILHSETSTAKAFLSRSVDKFRAPYARISSTVLRSTVFCGTVNHGGYLKDRSGNRRFWTVKCGDVIDVDGLRAARDQLWAEAVALFGNGEPWHLDADDELLMRDEHEDRLEVDPWQDPIAEWLAKNGDSPFAVETLLLGALKVKAASRNPNITRRVNHILEHLGFERQRRSRHGRRVYRYARRTEEIPTTPPCSSDSEASETGASSANDVGERKEPPQFPSAQFPDAD